MANNSKKLLQYVYDKLDKYSILKNANKIINNATTKAKTQISDSITNAIILKELRTVPPEPVKPVPEQLIHWWQWYQHLVGLNTVEKARQEVIALQEKLSKYSEMRLALHKEALIINNKVKEFNTELLKTKRDNPKYVDLTILENNALQDLSKNHEQLNLLENEEKVNFIRLTTAFNQYQDAQAVNAQKYKYLSIFVTIVAALFSLITTTIYHNQRLNEIKHGLLEMQVRSESNIKNYLEHYIGSSKKYQEENGWFTYTKHVAYTVGKYLVLKGILW